MADQDDVQQVQDPASREAGMAGAAGDAGAGADAQAGGATDAAADAAGAPVPGDPVARELAAVEEAMTAARAAVAPRGETPTVPGDDEVAALEQAHETLRTTLDRVERGR